MKTIQKTLLLLVAAFAVMGVFASCEKDDLPNGGEPRIRYVRVTSPESKDSLLVGAGQGQLIAIMGDNLQDAVEIWFNDQRATLTPTYITRNSILVSVPSRIPTEVSNNLRIIFSNGKELNHQFEVQISKPVVDGLLSEYVKTGEVATIRGNYFYAPVEVTFTGGVKGEIVSREEQLLRVRVPAGAQPGPIKVKTNFGETESEFWFRDNRNLLLTFDPMEGWWGSDYLVQGTDPLAINGNFLRIRKAIADWGWTEFAGGPESALSTKNNFPVDAVQNPDKYVMKFEINTLKPFNNSVIKFQIGQIFDPQPDPGAEPYQWKPPFDTKGQWQTVSISFDEVSKNFKQGWGVRPQGYGARVWFHGAGALDADIAFDNLRVVPKEHK